MRYKIILSAGELNPGNNSFSVMSSEGLNPICGNPSVYWAIKPIGNLDGAKIIISKKNKRLKEYLSYSFPNLKCDEIESRTILHSLQTALEDLRGDAEAVLILGDTCIEDDFDAIPADTLLVNNDIKDGYRWCLAEIGDDNTIKKFWDKAVPQRGNALIGVYCLSSVELLKESIKTALKNGRSNLSDAFAVYMQTRPLKAAKCDKWIDLGHVNGIVKARKKFMSESSRAFNSMKFIENIGLLEKTSTKIQKLKDERLWYTSLPGELSVLCPRIFDFEQTKDFAKITMEMYGYPNLSEMLLYGGASLEEWSGIVDSLFSIRKLFNKYEGPLLDKNSLAKIYVEKTDERLSQLRADKNFSGVLSAENLTINGVEYDNLPRLKPFMDDFVDNMTRNPVKSSIIHGDYCLSNILFDATHYIFKLIDPRGSFACGGIYGDPRYDIAKLRHSIAGRYDFIVAGLFKMKKLSENSFSIEIADLPFMKRLADYFDDMAEKNSYNLREIKFIEALLFLTMIPLHDDAPNRQTAFYLTAIQKFNELKNI